MIYTRVIYWEKISFVDSIVLRPAIVLKISTSRFVLFYDVSFRPIFLDPILRLQIEAKMGTNTKKYIICHYSTHDIFLMFVVVDLPRRGHRSKSPVPNSNCCHQIRFLAMCGEPWEPTPCLAAYGRVLS
jgi:hypothetical protein